MMLVTDWQFACWSIRNCVFRSMSDCTAYGWKSFDPFKWELPTSYIVWKCHCFPPNEASHQEDKVYKVKNINSFVDNCYQWVLHMTRNIEILLLNKIYKYNKLFVPSNFLACLS